jgi:zinc transport system substrate-binding protein
VINAHGRILLCACIGILLCGYADGVGAGERKLRVVTTIFPLYDFTRQVAGGNAEVTQLLPPGIEAHAFEPKPQDIARISAADVFIYTGKYMEPWAHDLLRGIAHKGLLVVDASRGIELIESSGHDEDERDMKVHGHQGKDPHIWLDMSNAQVMVETIAQALSVQDPRNASLYRANAGGYNAKLADIDRRFQSTFAQCRCKTLVYGGHCAFGYFVRRYGLAYVSPYRGFSPNAEPAPRAIVELSKVLERSCSKYIYYEELLDPKVARVIAEETGARAELLSAAHNISREEMVRGVTFLSIMEDNLKKLKEGLECS